MGSLSVDLICLLHFIWQTEAMTFGLLMQEEVLTVGTTQHWIQTQILKSMSFHSQIWFWTIKPTFNTFWIRLDLNQYHSSDIIQEAHPCMLDSSSKMSGLLKGSTCSYHLELLSDWPTCILHQVLLIQILYHMKLLEYLILLCSLHLLQFLETQIPLYDK